MIKITLVKEEVEWIWNALEMYQRSLNDLTEYEDNLICGIKNKISGVK